MHDGHRMVHGQTFVVIWLQAVVEQQNSNEQQRHEIQALLEQAAEKDEENVKLKDTVSLPKLQRRKIFGMSDHVRSCMRPTVSKIDTNSPYLFSL